MDKLPIGDESFFECVKLIKRDFKSGFEDDCLDLLFSFPKFSTFDPLFTVLYQKFRSSFKLRRVLLSPGSSTFLSFHYNFSHENYPFFSSVSIQIQKKKISIYFKRKTRSGRDIVLSDVGGDIVYATKESSKYYIDNYEFRVWYSKIVERFYKDTV